MKRIFSILLVSVFLLNIGYKASAIPAYPDLIYKLQSDKTTLSFFLKGDEKVNWGKTTDGFTLLRAKNGDWVYAISDNANGIIPSRIIAHNQEERTAEENNFTSNLDTNLFFSNDQLHTLKQMWEYKQTPDFINALNQAKSTNREIRVVVLLAEYPDRPFANDAEYFDALFNQVGYNVNGNEGSVKDYFNASTFGKVNVISGVYGPFMATGNAAAYANQTVGHIGASNLLREIIDLADPVVNFADYCSNGATTVDCVYMIYAGCAASSGEDFAIWPHRSALYPPAQKDGVYLFDYACSSELRGTTASGTQPPAIGAICHEFSHVVGLDDVYDTDYDVNGQAFTSGTWDIMDQGCYNNGERTPSLWSAFQRSSEGFLDLIELSTNAFGGIGSKTLAPLHLSNTAYRLSHSSSEYFILENRQKEGWDRFLPGHGMIVTHIDRSVPGWNDNKINTNATLLGIDIEEANSINRWARSGNPFPGTSNVTSFTDNSNPSSKSNNYANLNKPIERITENSTTKNIVFDFGALPQSLPRATTNAVTRVTYDSIYVSVSVSQTTDPIVEKGLIYSTTTTPTSAHTKVINQDVQNTFTSIITSISPSTTYYVRAYAKNAQSVYSYGEIIRVDVPCASISQFPYFSSFEANDNTLICWKEESNSYLANTWKNVTTTETGGIENAFEGTNFVLLSSSFPTAQARKLITPALNISILSQPYLKFNYAIKQKGSSQDALKIYYKTSLLSNWQLIKTYNNSTSDWTSDSIILPNKSNNYYIAFEGELYAGYGVCIDNVIVSEANLNAFPVVQTINADNITDVSIRVNSNVVSSGNTPIQARGIVYSTNPNPTLMDSYVSTTAGLGQYVINATNLNPNTLYYIRSYAQNQGLTSYGNQLTVLTKCERLNSFPYSFDLESMDTNCFEKEANWQLVNQDGTITAHTGTNFYAFKSENSASSKLIVPLLNLSYHDFTKLKFYYQKPNASSTLKVYYKVGIDGLWTELKTYSSQVNAWTIDSISLPNANNNYYIAFEAAADNGNGIYVDDISVEAVLQIPLVQTLSATLATYNSIQTSGNVSYSGLSPVTERGICYTTTSNLPTTADSKIMIGSGMGQFSTTISNLNPETTYRIRAYATNSYGTNYGQLITIVSPPTPIFNNLITGDQELCYNSTTQTFQGSLPTGGNGQYQYLWLQSSDNIQWDLASDADFRVQQSYYSFRARETAYYKRVVYSRLVSDTSNTILLRVYPHTRAGNIFRVQDTIIEGSSLRMELRAFEGSVLEWERKKWEFDWQTIPNSKDSIWLTDTPEDWGMYYYRARIKSGVCEELISGQDWTYVKQNIGLDEVNNQDNKIIVFPNPSKGEINVQYSGDKVFVGELMLYDINSKEILSISQVLKQGDNMINLNPIDKGTYLLVFKNKQQAMTKVIIVQ